MGMIPPIHVYNWRLAYVPGHGQNIEFWPCDKIIMHSKKIWKFALKYIHIIMYKLYFMIS